jgi:hypothetical protein
MQMQRFEGNGVMQIQMQMQMQVQMQVQVQMEMPQHCWMSNKQSLSYQYRMS